MEETGLKGVVEFFKEGPIVETWWREPALLFAGYYAIVNPSTMRRFLESLGLKDEGPSGPNVRLAAAEVVATALLEWDPDDSGGQQGRSAKRIQALFADREGMTRSRPALRARAGVTLAQLGDPRVEVLEPDQMQFCFVPRGEFWFGSGSKDEMAFDDEQEKETARRYKLDYGYWMARFPVTNAHFERFVTDEGYSKAQYWAEAHEAGVWQKAGRRARGAVPRPGPHNFGNPFTRPNHPVVGITWYEALAYTRWLTERWRGKLIGTDQEVALPSEPEWEKAARGGLEIIQTDFEPARPRPARSGLPTLDVSKDQLLPNEQPRRRYPWGPNPDPNRANCADTGIDATSAVGIFPGGASPYRCEEMSGNCMEWTRSLWGEDWQKPSFIYPYDPADGREEVHADRDVLRVVRGGGFDLDAWFARCAYRDKIFPVFVDNNLGFRLVVRPLL